MVQRSVNKFKEEPKWVNDYNNMSLYKKPEDIKYSVQIEQKDGKVIMIFSCDGGKFGAEEQLDKISVTPKFLLELIQKGIDSHLKE